MNYDPRDDFYARLGLPETATADQINDARRERLRGVHPDLPGGNLEAAQRTNEAADLLLDPQKRFTYDALRRINLTAPSARRAIVQVDLDKRPTPNWKAAFRAAGRQGGTRPGFATNARADDPGALKGR